MTTKAIETELARVTDVLTEKLGFKVSGVAVEVGKKEFEVLGASEKVCIDDRFDSAGYVRFTNWPIAFTSERSKGSCGKTHSAPLRLRLVAWARCADEKVLARNMERAIKSIGGVQFVSLDTVASRVAKAESANETAWPCDLKLAAIDFVLTAKEDCSAYDNFEMEKLC
jgi:hypothetical protein